MQTALDMITEDFDGRFVATAFMPLSMARPLHKLWVRSNGRNRYAKLFEQFTHSRPAYRIYLPIAKHLRINTQFSPVEIEVINAFHRYGDKYDLYDYYEGKALEKKSGRTVSVNKALQSLNEEELKQALSTASHADILSKIRAAKYTIAERGGGTWLIRYAPYDAENRKGGKGEIADDAQIVWDNKLSKPRKIDRQFIEKLGWTELDKLIDDVASDKAREGSGSSNAPLSIVISRHPYDVASISTGRDWTSCTNLGAKGTKHPETGGYSQTVPFGIQYGTIVAYCIRADDGNIRHPICRASIMPFINTNDPDDIVLDLTSREDAYGKWPAGFGYVLRKWLNMVNKGNKGGEYKIVSTLPYADNGGNRNMPPVSQNADVKTWMKKLNLSSYKVRKDGKIDVQGNVKFDSSMIDKRFSILPIKFGRVTGNFVAVSCGVSQMTGFPEKVDGDFDVSNNQITSLEDGPSHVGGSYIAEGNKLLTVLLGWPKFIGSDARFKNCNIQSMRGIPAGSTVVGSLDLQRNTGLRRIDGFPEKVLCKPSEVTRNPAFADDDQMGCVDFSNCDILTTVGLPDEIDGDLFMRENKHLDDLVGFPRKIAGCVLLSNCPLRDLSVVENVWIGGTFQFNMGKLTDADVAKFKPKYIGGGVQFAQHHLTKNCPTPPNVEKVFDENGRYDPSGKGSAIFLGSESNPFDQTTAPKEPKSADSVKKVKW
jgi:hypothetical protein